MLSCENITVRLGSEGTRILSDVSASFQAGAMNAVIGPSGCGKTTLMKAMLGLLPYESGCVRFAGDVVRDGSELLGRLAFAPQFSIAQPQLTVREVIRYALDLNVVDVAVKRERLEAILG